MKVSVQSSDDGDSRHEHITAVELSNGSVQLRSTVIDNIEHQGVEYWTFAGGVVADVVVRGCPDCGYGDYITTLPDSTTANNLLELPRI
ncbi:MAG TPA: DUF3892 domain-containing protein [Solirubrobacterales bacterium]